MSVASISLLSVVAVLCSMFAVSASIQTGLRLDSYSEDQVKGCYIHNKTLGVCFELEKDSMRITKTNGEEVVFYTKLDHDMVYYQILDQGFIGHGRNMTYVPDYIPRMPQDLREYLKQITEGSPTEREAVKIHYQEAVSELHYVPGIQLLELVSQGLTDNSTQVEILKPFHALCFNLLKAANVEIPPELRALHDLNEDPSRQRRCQSLKYNRHNKCLGMCGKGCWCWRWVCGDCCWNRGCYEHDVCCGHDWWSTECLLPFFHRFRCSGFGGYPGCLS